jgi:hypothetical protein
MIDLNKTKRLWAVEDKYEYTLFSSYIKEHVEQWLQQSPIIQQNDEAYLVMEYSDINSIIPEQVVTVRTFLLP